ncbi:MAG: hypothetical protein PSV40_10330 [Polaromonas sp.]|uniref:DUF6998 domain-containing protein n=1 Tax=Polaromonas sp. TaxID=1869339 RepID=UPI00248A47CF|nr:hypothetical protein [Polaromonas sp.]MDI1269479.1 hypothetical protein [Polaromonas sp.]
MSKHQAIKESLALIFQGIEGLKEQFPNRRFTIDGRLVGDIGEVIAALEYDIELDVVSQPLYDGTSLGRRVQIKATFADSLTFKGTPDFLLGFKLYRDGRFEEVFNGPGNLVFEKYKHRSGIGKALLSFPNAALKQLSAGVMAGDRIPRRSAGREDWNKG